MQDINHESVELDIGDFKFANILLSLANDNNTSMCAMLIDKMEYFVAHMPPNQDYNETSYSLEFSVELFNNLDDSNMPNLSKFKELMHILKFRQDFYDNIMREYDLMIIMHHNRLLVNIEDLLKYHGVPQYVRILAGLLDMLVAIAIDYKD